MNWKLDKTTQDAVRAYIKFTFNDYWDVDGFSVGNAAHCAANQFNITDEEELWDCEAIAEELRDEDWEESAAYWADELGFSKR